MPNDSGQAVIKILVLQIAEDLYREKGRFDHHPNLLALQISRAVATKT